MQKSDENKGIVFGFQTDTVWGLGCLPDDKLAVDKIYEIKNRDRTKPLILMSHDVEALKKYVTDIPKYAYKLLDEHFPGGLTLVLRRSGICPKSICAGFETVGIRVPNSKNFMDLTQNIEGSVLATTSLNLSNQPPCKTFDEANSKFGNIVKIVKPKYEEKLHDIPSTIVLCAEDKPLILREGSVKI